MERQPNEDEVEVKEELEVILEEYRTLRQEIVTRMQLEHNFVHIAILLFGGFLGFLGVLAARSSTPGEAGALELLALSETFLWVLLAIIPVYWFFVLVYFRQDAYILGLARCIEEKLAPRVRCANRPARKAFSWERFVVDNMRRRGDSFLAGSRYVVLSIPAILSWVAILSNLWANTTLFGKPIGIVWAITTAATVPLAIWIVCSLRARSAAIGRLMKNE